MFYQKLIYSVAHSHTNFQFHDTRRPPIWNNDTWVPKKKFSCTMCKYFKAYWIGIIIISVYSKKHIFEKLWFHWQVFNLFCFICHLQQRPSYLLPYIGRHLLTLVVFALCALGTLFYIVMGDHMIIVVHGRRSNEYIRLTHNSVVYAMIVNLVLYFPLVSYFFYVLCNYSKVRQNDDRLHLFL